MYDVSVPLRYAIHTIIACLNIICAHYSKKTRRRKWILLFFRWIYFLLWKMKVKKPGRDYHNMRWGRSKHINNNYWYVHLIIICWCPLDFYWIRKLLESAYVIDLWYRSCLIMLFFCVVVLYTQWKLNIKRLIDQ